MKRRAFLLGASALLASPFYLGRSYASDVDVVVVGAGAAGLAATRELRAKGLSVLCIEAQGRVGGRVFSDPDVFGVPYDIGAHWLHNGETNPFAVYGRKAGFDIYESPSDLLYYVGDRPANEAELEAYEEAVTKAYRAMVKAARRGQDVSPASIMPDLGDWALSTNFAIGAYENAKDFDHFSRLDWYSNKDGTDYYCRQGFGALFDHAAQDVPVSTDVSADAIRWGGQGVQVETSDGTINAKALVITVSTGVLASGDISFEPPLPVKKQEAVQALTMGTYFHIALKTKDSFFQQMGLEGVEDGLFGYQITEELAGSPKGFGALVNSGGTGLTYCDMGGNFAKHLLEEGAEAAQDFVISELKRMFGSKIEQVSTYDWNADPYAYGSYASAEPGGTWARAELRKPIADKIWFAGEALSKDEWSTVAGAHKSGELAARQISKRVKAG